MQEAGLGGKWHGAVGGEVVVLVDGEGGSLCEIDLAHAAVFDAVHAAVGEGFGVGAGREGVLLATDGTGQSYEVAVGRGEGVADAVGG